MYRVFLWSLVPIFGVVIGCMLWMIVVDVGAAINHPIHAPSWVRLVGALGFIFALGRFLWAVVLHMKFG